MSVHSSSSLTLQAREATHQQTIDRCHTHVTALKAHVDNLFQNVMGNRFRDVAEEIRALVIEGIGTWIEQMPSEFLQDKYLKYVAWALSDKVRQAAVSGPACPLTSQQPVWPSGPRERSSSKPPACCVKHVLADMWPES